LPKYEKIEAYKYDGKIYESKEEVDKADERNVARSIVLIVGDMMQYNEYDKAMAVINKLLGSGVTSRKALEKMLVTLERLELEEG